MEELKPCLSSSSVTTAMVVRSKAIELSSSLPENGRMESQPIGSAGYRDSRVQDFKRFKNSSSPSRFLHYQENVWVDFPQQVFDELSAGFIAGKAVLELSIDGTCYLFDFLRMLKINTSTEAAESIAWIDVHGRFFFPTTVLQNHQLAILMTIQSSNYGSFASNSGREIVSGDKLYKVVEKLFRNGMRRAGCNAVVTNVQRCSFSGLSGSLRLKVFGMTMDMTKKARGGVANVKFGWYGASAEDVADIVKHGFGKANSGELGLQAHGLGVHLSPPLSPHASSLLLSRADANGERHIVLCRVIMGNSEKVEAGSLQSHPSNDSFDSGVDDLKDPKWYVVWTTGMNTRIIPEYVVSFKLSLDQPHGVVRRAVGSARRRPTFRNLLIEIGRSLPSSRMHSLVMLYKQHKAGKITRDTFFRCFRSMVDDKLLASAIRKVRGNSS